MQINIMGKRWTLAFTRIPQRQIKCPMCEGHGVHVTDSDGFCEAPHKTGKRIVVNSQLRGKQRLETLIHEITHAAFWSLDEEYVEQFAHDLAEILTRQGYSNDRLGR